MRSLRRNKRLRKSTKRHYRKRTKNRSYKKRRYSRRRNMRGGSLQADWETKAKPFFTTPSTVVTLINQGNNQNIDTLKSSIKTAVSEGVGPIQQMTKIIIDQTHDYNELVTTLNDLVNVDYIDPFAGLQQHTA